MLRSYLSNLQMNFQNLFKYVRAFSPRLLAFVAAISVSVDATGGILLRLPALDQLHAHADLYAAGLALVIEWGLRATPSSRNRSLLTTAAKILDAVVPNRSNWGNGYHETGSALIVEPVGQPVAYGPAA